jgi:hypothetical protein
VVVKESLLPPLFDHYFVSTKTVVAKIVTIYEDVPNSNEKSLSIKAQVEARGKNVFTLDLTPTIKKFGLMPFATMYGDLNLKVVFDVPPTLKIKDGAFLYTSKVRVDGDLTKVTKDGNIPKIMKLENEGFALEASVKVSIERSTQPEKEKQFKAQKMINLEEDPNASLQFEAVVVPQFFTMSYGKWAPSTTFPKVDPKTDSLSYFINKIAAQVIATMPPIRVPLPVKEELAAMGLPGSPLELSLDCTQNSQMRIGMKGDFDFTGIIDQFLYAGANSIDIAGQGGQKKNGFNLI